MANLDPGVLTILISTLCGTIATLATVILQYMREGRAHEWQQQQAVIDKKERNAAAEAVKVHAAYAANVVADNTERVAMVLSNKIDENTEISVRAFDEANGVNKKILAIGELRQKEHRTSPIEEVSAVSRDTNKTVHKIDEKVSKIVKE